MTVRPRSIRVREIRPDADGKLRCELCRRRYLGLGTHIWRAHGWTGADYRAEFGYGFLQAPSVRRKRARCGSDPTTGRRPPLPTSRASLLRALRKDLRRPTRPSSATHDRLHYAAVQLFGSWHAAVEAAGRPDKLRRDLTRETVLDELRRYHAAGGLARYVPLYRADQTLCVAAGRFFGGTAAAFRAAGVEPAPRSRRWSRERVCAAIQAAAGGAATLSQSQATRHTPGLFAAARELFGRWSAALRAAGLRARPWRRWTPNGVFEEIQRLARSLGRAPSLEEATPALRTAAHVYLGAWTAAVRAAGLGPLPAPATASRPRAPRGPR